MAVRIFDDHFAAGLKEIPTTYYEAADIDGANKFQRFCEDHTAVSFPDHFVQPCHADDLGVMSFTQAFVITQGGPNDSTNFYALYVYNHAFKWSNMGYASECHGSC